MLHNDSWVCLDQAGHGILGRHPELLRSYPKFSEDTGMGQNESQSLSMVRTAGDTSAQSEQMLLSWTEFSGWWFDQPLFIDRLFLRCLHT